MLLLPWPLAARAATLVVDPAGGGDHATIGAAVGAASPGDVIVVAPGDYEEDDVEIGADLWVVARDPSSPPTLHSASVDGVFRVVDGDVTLRDLVFVGSGESRGLVQTGGALSVQGCTFSTFSTTSTAGEAGGGGAMRVEGGDLVLHHTTFVDNAATFGGHLWVGADADVEAHATTFDGGFASLSGGAVSVARGGTFEASYTTFDRNTAVKSGGAVGPASALGGRITISDSVLSRNAATGLFGDGGAVAIDDLPNGQNLVERTLFCSNTAERWGGAVLASGGSVSLLRSAFVGNGTVGDAPAAGGAIRSDTLLTLDHATLMDNGSGLGRAMSAGANVANVGDSVFAHHTGSGELIHSNLPSGTVYFQPGNILFDIGALGSGDFEAGYDGVDPQLTLAEDRCDPAGLVPAATSPLWARDIGAVVDGDGDDHYVLVGDCDDDDGSVYPGADEGVADGVDQDCDGLELCYTDADGDGLGESPTVASYDLDCTGFGEAPTDDGDCAGDGAGDADGDGVCDGSDLCAGAPDHEDADGDGTPDGCDACPEDEDDACTPTDDTATEPDRSGGVIAADGQPPGCNCASGFSSRASGALVAALALGAAYRRKDRASQRKGRAHASR